MAAYADGDDLAARHDIRVLQQLASDDDSPLSRADTLAHEFVTTALEDASGEVESALRRGGIYTTANLEALTGNSLAKLKRMVCTVAMALMFERRPGPFQELANGYMERADKMLKELSSGDKVFEIDGHDDANFPTIDGPTSIDYDRINTIADRMAPRYFPRREGRLPTDRG